MCTAPTLTAFIHVREFDVPKVPPRTGWSWPNKGTAETATAGERSLVKLAFDRRSVAIRLKLAPAAPAGRAPQPAPRPGITFVDVPLLSGLGASAVGAGQFLANVRWRRTVLASLVGRVGDAVFFAAADQERADLLVRLEQGRLAVHVDTKVSDPARRDHICLRWFAANLARAAAVSVLFGHIKADLRCATPASCLLAGIRSFLPAAGANALLELAYLYNDTNDEQHIRSGKTVGENRNFGVRHPEHAEGSKLASVESRKSAFYTYYPDCEAPNANDAVRRGYFQNLRQLVAVGLDRSNAAAVDALVAPANGILDWPADVLQYVAKVKFAGCTTLVQKQLHMVGYLFELHYELLLAPRHDVSSNPGFETCLGVFGR
jgi:hypothetical protein